MSGFLQVIAKCFITYALGHEVPQMCSTVVLRAHVTQYWVVTIRRLAILFCSLGELRNETFEITIPLIRARLT